MKVIAFVGTQRKDKGTQYRHLLFLLNKINFKGGGVPLFWTKGWDPP
jgi:hypothetical protein